jgi:hypothetical protein
MPLTGKRHEPGSFARLPLFPAAMKLFLRRACVTRPLEAFPHRRERRAGFRNRPSREGRVIRFRSVWATALPGNRAKPNTVIADQLTILR